MIGGQNMYLMHIMYFLSSPSLHSFHSQRAALSTLKYHLFVLLVFTHPTFIPKMTSEIPPLCTLTSQFTTIFTDPGTESAKSWNLRGKLRNKCRGG